MKAKKVLVWLCAAAMLVSAAGCGSSAASTGSDAAGGQGVQEAEGTAKEDLPLAKVSGRGYGTSWRRHESECKNTGRNDL